MNTKLSGYFAKLAAAFVMSAVFVAWAEPVRVPPDDTSSGDLSVPSINYKLLPKDTVHIKVFQEDDLETTARIDRDGNISFPLLGTARIGGQTVQEATATMERLLHEYLVKPQVSLSILSYSKRRFTILGQVNKPGTFDMPDESSVNLLEAVGMAGGYTRIANPSKITVKRTVQGRETIFNLDAKRMLKETTTVTFQVLPGDTILVGEALF